MLTYDSRIANCSAFEAVAGEGLIIDKSHFQLELSLGYVLNRAAGRMKRALDRRLATHGLTTSQWSIMASIAREEGLTQMELGRRSLFDRPTTTGILTRLEVRGLIERRQSPTDSRARAIFFTTAGKRLFAKLPPLAASVNAMGSRNLSTAEQRQLLSLLNKVAENFEQSDSTEARSDGRCIARCDAGV